MVILYMLLYMAIWNHINVATMSKLLNITRKQKVKNKSDKSYNKETLYIIFQKYTNQKNILI